MKRGMVTFLIAVVWALAWPATSTAQVAQAELRGSVIDESRAPIPGATVTATHVETGAARTAATSSNGVFVMPALPVGSYRVKVEMSGFSTLIQERLALAVGQSAVLSFGMKLASVQETVTVQGEAPLIETTKTALSGRVETTQVENLPLNGRNWLDLVALVPGARGNPGQIQAGSAGGDMAKYQVDGVDVSGQCCGGSNQGYSQENIAELQVLTNRFDVEHGRVSGIVINAVTKSGTNSFKGAAFGFLRDDRFDARNFFTNQVSPFKEKQLGANLGGPIVHDKIHFFASYEYQQRDVTARPNTGIAAFDVDASQDITRHYATLRLDAQLNPKHRLFVRSSQYNWEQLNVDVGGRTTLSAGYSRPSDNNDLSLGETWVISDRAVHELRLGFSRIDNSLVSNSGTPRYTFPSAILGSPTNSPQWWKELNVDFKSTLSYFVPAWHGQHRLKAGFQYFRPKFWGELPSVSYGSYNFSRDPADFNDPRTYPLPTSYSVSLGDFHYSVTNPVYAGFVNDDWTLSSKLTFNLGFRYDVETGVKNTDFPNPIETGERKADKDNISPRVGLAWDLHGDGKMVVRLGYGRYYDKVLLNITSNERRVAQGQIISVTITNPDFTNPLQGRTFQDYKNQNLPRNTTIIGNDYATPRQDTATLGIARQLGSRFAAQLDYVHVKGVNEPRSRNVNLFEDPQTHLPRDPTVFGRPYPQYLTVTRYETSAKSKYDAIQVGVAQREAGPSWLRYQFQGSYTLSWTKDDHDGNRFANVTNPFNLQDEYSWSSADQRHRFVVNGSAHLPWDITLATIFFAGSKRPINIGSTLDPFRTGSTGRWLDTTGRTLTRYGERRQKGDYKWDVRIAKTVHTGKLAVQGIVEAFNVLNTKNYGSYGTSFGSRTYLQPGNSTNLFYQPRQLQVAARVTF